MPEINIQMNEFIYFLSGIAFYFLLDILKAYYIKKVENEAEIEDLPLITKISESVKQDFRKEISTINAKLSVLTNQRSLIDEKAVHVINKFFEKCLEIRDLHSQNFGDFAGKDLGQLLVDYQLKVDEAHRNLYSDYHVLLLYHNNDEELIKSAEEIISASSAVHETFKSHYGKIKISILNEAEAIPQTSYSKAVEESNRVISEYYEDQKGNLEYFNKSFSELMRSLNKSISEFGLKNSVTH
ncbi:MAG: hypothetical protein JJU13_08305 [Balneolaceae bacterium]|nr:hypothetical protein [Balneolaceae bacterium]